jgi:hypothetical protein
VIWGFAAGAVTTPTITTSTRTINRSSDPNVHELDHYITKSPDHQVKEADGLVGGKGLEPLTAGV